VSIRSSERRAPLGIPPEAWEPLLRIARLATRPLERFLRIEAASGIVLLVTTVVALAWANSPWASSYVQLWGTPVGFRFGGFVFERPLDWFVNDVLMAVFFFVVGMEIRRELHHGELSEWRRAVLPAAAALGGMIAPALLYLVLARGPAIRAGWGVPMATDIAFAVGILTLLGRRVPPALRVLLLALAVIDDLGAIVVIALFYSPGIALGGLLVAAAGVGGIYVLQRLGVRSRAAFLLPGVVAWAGIYAAGVHPTIAGVLVGFATPVRAWLGPEGFLQHLQEEVGHLTRRSAAELEVHELELSRRRVGAASREALSPSEGLIAALHPWVAFCIMPLFALANAGVSLDGLVLDASGWKVASGVAIGLVVGKPIGVLAAIWLATRLRIGTLPIGLDRAHLLVLGVVAGVGFTMSLFIAQLAFHGAGATLAAAKLGVLTASAAAGLLALVLGRTLLAPEERPGAARTVDEAESATEI
jgi:NhaA family Na+:H+ antiporter